MTTIVSIIAALGIGLVALISLFIGGMRTKWPPVVDTVRRINIRYLNPQQLKDAGQPGAYAELLRHTGRTTGLVHETPLTIHPSDDGFVIGLVYGDRTQWLKNVLAAGRAEVVREGVTYEVDRPQVVPISEMDAYFSPADQRISGLFGVSQALRLYHAEHD